MDANVQNDTAPTDLERIADFNRTDRAFPHHVTIHELIEAQIHGHGPATAVLCQSDTFFGSASMTYDQVNERANQVAHSLRAKGAGPGNIVGIMAERSFGMMIGLLGILKAGAAYLPISPDNPPDRIHYILKDADVRTLLTTKKAVSRLSFDGRVIDLENPEIYQGEAGNPQLINTPNDLAYVIYTSGSTGRPKGVMIEHRSVVNRLHWMQSAYPIGPDDVILQKTPFFFDVSVWELFWWAIQGAKLCFLNPGGERMPLAIVDAIRKHRISVLHFVPSMLNVFLEYLSGKSGAYLQGLVSVRQIFASGEELTVSQVRRFNEIVRGISCAKLTNLYGPTEATVDVTYFDCPGSINLERIPIGRPIDNIKLSIAKDGRAAAIGEAGELCIAGVGLARGYLNNPALTREKFVDNAINPGERVYRTGDIARWLPDGNVEFLGRVDHQIKIRGLRIELGEIENSIRGYPGVTDCIVVAKKYSENVILLIAYVVSKVKLATEDVKRHLKSTLPEYMIPNHFESIAQIPLTPSGKADREALPQPVIRAKT